MEVSRTKEPDIKFLQLVRNLADQNGIILIFDGVHQVLDEPFAVCINLVVLILIWLCLEKHLGTAIMLMLY